MSTTNRNNSILNSRHCASRSLGHFFVFLVEHRGVLLMPSDQRRIRDNFSSHILCRPSIGSLGPARIHLDTRFFQLSS
jgi:hypothetical protein